MSDSVKVSIDALRQANKWVVLYDSCQEEVSTLLEGIDSCERYKEQAEKTIASAYKVINEYKTSVDAYETVTKNQQTIIGNNAQILKDYKKLNRRSIIGFTVGGFAIGAAIPILIFLLK
ncbi:MAG: hypothetical protein JST49_03255 [Bacteroidetes bacterium]|nr:hypothetical protein [Bacteroidota bacterium]